jgi:DNA-binding IclR family transcriptional regulator
MDEKTQKQRIKELFQEKPDTPLGAKGVSRALGIPAPSARRVLKELFEEEVLDYAPENYGCYILRSS